MKNVAVILNLNKQYDRSIVRGIARFAKENKDWSLYIEDEPEHKVPDFRKWECHGIIADLDDKEAYDKIKSLNIPIVGLGGGYLNTDSKIPYVFTDNKSISILAAEHLFNCGLRNFAFCNIKATEKNGWAKERADAFKDFVEEKKCPFYIFEQTESKREDLILSLMKWLEKLPNPIGLMAANDARARLVLEACRRLNISVPEQIAVVGVDDDPMMCELCNPPLSSVIQGTDRLGYEASKILNQLMQGISVESLVIEPRGITIRQSSDLIAIDDEITSKALAYIRLNACNGICVENVARHLGVSRSTIEKKFIKILKQSVHDRITGIKVKKAKELLLETTLSMKEVAAQSGFNTNQYMNKVLKDLTGKTPAQLRSQKG